MLKLNLDKMFKQFLILCIIATAALAKVKSQQSRRAVFEKKGTVMRYYIQGRDKCRQSLYYSDVKYGYTPGDCPDHGYPIKHQDIGSTWYTRSRLRRAVFEQEGTVARFFIETDVGRCRQSLYDSAVALGYTPGTCSAQGYPTKHVARGFTWYTKSRLRRAVNKKQGKVIRHLIYSGKCKQSLCDSDVVRGYKEGTCSAQGYPIKHGVRGSNWYSKA
jgi:ribosomal protein L37E